MLVLQVIEIQLVNNYFSAKHQGYCEPHVTPMFRLHYHTPSHPWPQFRKVSDPPDAYGLGVTPPTAGNVATVVTWVNAMSVRTSCVDRHVQGQKRHICMSCTMLCYAHGCAVARHIATHASRHLHPAHPPACLLVIIAKHGVGA
jgi:hypothetical protein